eukprot:COSAG02_NODE_54513_length_295_cov_1.831633_1_plen_51_part_10
MLSELSKSVLVLYWAIDNSTIHVLANRIGVVGVCGRIGRLAATSRRPTRPA